MRSKSSLSYNSNKFIFINLIFLLLIISFLKITKNFSTSMAKKTQNCHIYRKMIETKVVENWISYEKLIEAYLLFTPGVELRVFHGKVGLLSGRTLRKILIISKNALNKSCAELNFLQKLDGSIPLFITEVEVGGLRRFDVILLGIIFQNE